MVALCAYSLHIPRCSILPRDHWKGRWPTTALNGILLILKKIKRLTTDRKKRRWRTWLHWIGPYWSCTEESWSQRSKQKEHQNQSDHSEEQITVLWSPKWNIQWCRKLWQIFSLGKKWVRSCLNWHDTNLVMWVKSLRKGTGIRARLASVAPSHLA